VDLGEHRAVFDVRLGDALQVARVVQQGHHHAEDGAARADALLRCDAAVVTVEQPRHRQRHVEGVAQVVVERVAGEVAGKLAVE